jgi:hypothetical protein
MMVVERGAFARRQHGEHTNWLPEVCEKRDGL